MRSWRSTSWTTASAWPAQRRGIGSGVGLAAMRERAAELGGSVTLGPHPPHGTHLHVRLPAVLP